MELSPFDLTEPGGWRRDAACAGSPTGLFFEAGELNEERALAICASCPVSVECLAFAIETRQDDGVWGGLTAKQRMRLRRYADGKNVGMKRGDKDHAWSEADLATLRRLAHLGAGALAEILDRSQSSVERKAERERISLRRPGERRGKAQGDGQVSPALREEIVGGKVRLVELEERVRAGPAARLCPGCALRPIEIGRTGLCQPCHAKRVLEAYEDVQEGRAASRALDAARARAYRKRHR